LVLGEVVLMGLLIARLVLAQLEFVTEAGARAAQDARFRALVQQSSDAILVVSRDGRLSYASPPFAAMVGLAETDLTGRELRDLVTVESPGGLEAWLADPGMQPLARWTVGDQRHIEALATDHTADPGIGGVVINARDISERVRLEAQLRQAQKLEAVGRFASSVAHDFNNVLTVITANLHFLRDDRPGEGREELAQMEVAAARGATLASQLTALSRPRAGAAPAVDLAGAVRAIQRTLDVLLPSSIQTTVTAPATRAMVRLDEVQVEQLLLNLALNSRDAMLEGGRLDITLAVTDPPPDEPVESDARWARLDVRDTGSGMSAEVMQQALEPFFTTKDSSRGTGLGLYSVRSIVSGAGGRVDLASEPGVGTTVTLWLPLVVARASRTRPRAEQASPRGEGRVLVVDDEAAVRRILVRQLTKAGYEVLEREDGQAAFEYLQAHDGAADLVLTDLVMPRMSGQELASRISERWPQIRLLIMSGTPDVLAGRREAWARIPVIAKPLGLADVAARVAAALRTDGVSREEPSVPG
jgi:PAS domain S-box-containing protein